MSKSVSRESQSCQSGIGSEVATDRILVPVSSGVERLRGLDISSERLILETDPAIDGYRIQIQWL